MEEPLTSGSGEGPGFDVQLFGGCANISQFLGSSFDQLMWRRTYNYYLGCDLQLHLRWEDCGGYALLIKANKARNIVVQSSHFFSSCVTWWNSCVL